VDKEFLASRISARPRILGLQLHPLSLGHRLILERAESPFISDGIIGIVDVIFAVLVCSMRFEEATAFFDSYRCGKQIRKWVRKLRKLDFISKIQEFRRYWFYGNLVPTYSIVDDKGANEWSGTPWPQRLKIVLMSELGLTESEVLNRPLRLCWWDYLCFEELRGNVNVISDEIRAGEDSLVQQANQVAEALKND